MRKNYKYLMILIFILNFTNIYSQSNNYVYTWYNQSIGTLYIDKQLLESSASMISQYFNTLSQYLGPLAPIISKSFLKYLPYLIENLPYLISIIALSFIFYRFLNIINEKLNIINDNEHPKLSIGIISLGISLFAAYFVWPFVILILGTAFIIKVFRIGKSKLESFKETLGKINSGLKSIFSRAISDIKNFDKDTDKILKDINKLYEILNHPYIRDLLNSIENDIETLNNIISQLLKEAENEKLTLYRLKVYLLKFNRTYNDAKIKIEQLNRTINNIFSNTNLLRRFGNSIFRTNLFTQKYLVELRNILSDLNARLNTTYKESQEIFGDLNKFLFSAEAINKKYESEININLKKYLNDLLSSGNNKPLIRELQKVGNTIAAIDKNQNISPLKKMEILSEMNKSTKKLSEYLRKFKGNSKKLLNFINKNYKKIIAPIRSALKISKKR